jgi:heme/copper-type cytochrome/quinol oxidase subunit 1
MNKKQKKKAAIWVTALSIICGFIIWHIIDWYSTGMYERLFDLVEEGKAYLSVLYNLGLMTLLSLMLALLLNKINDLLGNERNERDNPDNEDMTKQGLW